MKEILTIYERKERGERRLLIKKGKKKRRKKSRRWNETRGVYYRAEGCSRDKGGQKTGRGFGGKEVDHFTTRTHRTRSAQLTSTEFHLLHGFEFDIVSRFESGSNPSARSSNARRLEGEKEIPLTGSLSLFNILVISASRRAAQCCLCTLTAAFNSAPRGSTRVLFASRVRHDGSNRRDFEVSVSSSTASSFSRNDGLIILARDIASWSGDGFDKRRRRLYIEAAVCRWRRSPRVGYLGPGGYCGEEGDLGGGLGFKGAKRNRGVIRGVGARDRRTAQRGTTFRE